MQQREEVERTRAEAERIRAEAKENEYKAEIKQLQSTVIALVLDLKSLQDSVPNWDSLGCQSIVSQKKDSEAIMVRVEKTNKIQASH